LAAQWLLACQDLTQEHFKPPDYGAQRHAKVEIAFNFGRQQALENVEGQVHDVPSGSS